MKEFIKIFAGLVLIIGAFTVGKNYGVKTVVDTPEYKQQVSAQGQLIDKDEQLQKIKISFQNLLDSTDLKLGHELLGKMMVILLTDLSLKISKEQEDQIAIGKNYCMAGRVAPNAASAPVSVAPASQSTLATKTEAPPNKAKTSWAHFRPPQFKSFEWLGMNSSTEKNSLRQLARTEIKNMNEFISQGSAVEADRYLDFVGEYKGTIIDIKNQVYATLTTKINVLDQKASKSKVSVETTLIRNGEETRSSTKGTDFGWSHPETYAIIIEQDKDRYLQIYKLGPTQKLAGNYYEVMPNGTTKLIGQFALTRIDRF
jgi:hypothetical protein